MKKVPLVLILHICSGDIKSDSLEFKFISLEQGFQNHQNCSYGSYRKNGQILHFLFFFLFST